ncbi:Fur family transcriptional regulator, zinc uptake regulator/Fur family transcriptional regulator, ferric uptake regulator [Tindallia magadiensis]|uniref:Fur family transcriptional regulator, zinc uptake regulator/Fur family transcriptional regulator, ferric uptake regulator n=1 Tax=Tindallia magadiensis TaxID=69895 RepID=A0A1I3A946_9FIRM|nr:transcriptional repressor [Tindallia magadiensis]SFH46584.1 Fur family transcriptional regulator, zinc uptake regulator/Fur family transcriptional regulator, ferric uptake regulator [Tindallia magadiensis]
MDQEINRCQQELKAKGYKFTKQRRIIIEILLSSQRHLMTASHIYEEVKKRKCSINFSTVYRNLETLLECGLIRKALLQDGIASYEINTHHHHHHLICLQCHDAEMIHFCPYEEINKHIRKNTNFYPVEHKIEIYGYCEQCCEKNTKDLS